MMSSQESYLVLYYSNTGNNSYIAKKIAEKLYCDTEEIIPKSKSIFWLILKSVIKIPATVKPIIHDLSHYENVILLGPIWMGSIVSPIRGFLKKYLNQIHSLYFVTACGGSDDQKNDKFGYTRVFQNLKGLINKKLRLTAAIPVTLSESEFDPKKQNVLDIRINNQNYSGGIEYRLNSIIDKIKTIEEPLEIV